MILVNQKMNQEQKVIHLKEVLAVTDMKRTTISFPPELTEGFLRCGRTIASLGAPTLN